MSLCNVDAPAKLLISNACNFEIHWVKVIQRCKFSHTIFVLVNQTHINRSIL